MEHQQRSVSSFIVQTCLLVAGAVFFLWLREVDLAFLATYRIPIGIIVVAAGFTLGIFCGLFIGKHSGRSLGADRTPVDTLKIGIFLLLIGFIGIAVDSLTKSRLNLLAYWQTAQHLPLNLTKLTGDLFSLLTTSFIASYIPVFGFLLIQKIWLSLQTARATT